MNFNNLKSDLKHLIAFTLPNQGRWLINVYRKVALLKQVFTVKIRLMLQRYPVPDPEKVYWISPDRIEYHTDFGTFQGKEFSANLFDGNKDKGKVFNRSKVQFHL